MTKAILQEEMGGINSFSSLDVEEGRNGRRATKHNREEEIEYSRIRYPAERKMDGNQQEVEGY